MPLYYKVRSASVSKEKTNKLDLLQQHAQKLEYLTHLINTILPIHGQWRVAGLNNNQLCLSTTEPTAAAQVRYLQQQYLKQIRMFNELKAVKTLKVIVTSSILLKKEYSKTVKQSLSEQTCQHLMEAANLFSTNQEVSEALKRIATAQRQKA